MPGASGTTTRDNTASTSFSVMATLRTFSFRRRLINGTMRDLLLIRTSHGGSWPPEQKRFLAKYAGTLPNLARAQPAAPEDGRTPLNTYRTPVRRGVVR